MDVSVSVRSDMELVLNVVRNIVELRRRNNMGAKDYFYLCKEKGCYLRAMPGHKNMCIYHWRKREGLPTITTKKYETLNQIESEGNLTW